MLLKKAITSTFVGNDFHCYGQISLSIVSHKDKYFVNSFYYKNPHFPDTTITATGSYNFFMLSFAFQHNLLYNVKESSHLFA